jgi:hypothetical protein
MSQESAPPVAADEAPEGNWTASDDLLDAVKTFGPNHPLRIRIEGAQSTTYEQLVSASAHFQQFIGDSDKLYGAFDDSLSAHVALLSQIKKDLRALEDRVFSVKLRAAKIAEHDGVDVSAILEKNDSEAEAAESLK